MADKDRFYELRIDLENEFNYVLNPWRGTIHKWDSGNAGIHRLFLNAHSSTFVISSDVEIVNDSLFEKYNRLDAPLIGELSLSTRNLRRWDFMASDEQGVRSRIEYNDTILFDWLNNPDLMYSAEDALYRTSFQIGDTLTNKQYILDLGEIHGTVEVKINTELIGDCIIPPFRMDITGHISPGFNTVEIWLTSPLKNRLIGRAIEGDDRYKRYLKQVENLNPNGLKGPVLIWEVDKNSELVK